MVPTMIVKNVINFSNRALKLNNAEDAKEMVETIKTNCDSTSLNLSGNTLGIPAAEQIGIAVSQCSSLQYCHLHDLFTGRSKTEIAPALRHISVGLMASGARLVEIDLSDNAFGPNGVVGVTDLLASPTCYTLQILRMNNQGLGHEGCRHLADALIRGRKEGGKQSLLLKVFVAGRNRLENVGAGLLSKVFCEMGSLEKLVLNQNGIGMHGIEGIESLANILKSNRQLRILNLSDNSVTPRGAGILVKSLRHLANLEELNLSDCILQSSGVSKLASSLLIDADLVPELHTLSLAGNELRTQAGLNLVLTLGSRPGMRHLDLNANEFGRSGIDRLMHALQSIDMLHLLSNDACQDQDDLPAGFDEDQGSASEEEEEKCEEEDMSSSGESEGELEKRSDSDYGHVVDKEDLQGQSTFNTSFSQLTVNNKSGAATDQSGPKATPTGFSFLSNFSFTGNKSTTSGGSGLFSTGVGGSGGLFSTSTGGGLFQSLSTTTTTTTTPGSFLFGSVSGTNGPRHSLFSPPTLKLGPKSVDLTSLKPHLSACLSTPIAEKRDLDAFSHHPQLTLLARPDLVRLALDQSPSSSVEAVVRLGLSLASSSDTSSAFADLLLASLLGNNSITAAADSTLSVASRAVNCLLVHLGSLKAERGSVDHQLINSDKGGDQLSCNYALVSRLVQSPQHRSSIEPEIWRMLSFVVTVNPTASKVDDSSPSKVKACRDQLLSSLEEQFASFKI